MNKESYNQAKREIEDFDKNYTKLIPIESIQFSENDSQVRQNGHVQTMVPRYALAMENGVRFPPISLRSLPNKEYELKDGATRLLAAKMIGKKEILAQLYYDEIIHNNQEWFEQQCKENDHIQSTPNSSADIKNQISKRVAEGFFENKFQFKYQSNPNEYVSRALDYLQDVYKNSNLGRNKFENMLRKALEGEISLSFESYSKMTAMEFIDSNNKLGWSKYPEKSYKSSIGDICNGICFYPCDKISQIKTNAFANGAYKKIDNDIDVYIVFYVGNLWKATESEIFEQREKAFEIYQKINKKYDIFKGFLMLPQIKSGEFKENSYSLIEKKNANKF